MTTRRLSNRVRAQVERAMTPGFCRLAVWTERGKVLDLGCEVRA